MNNDRIQAKFTNWLDTLQALVERFVSVLHLKR